MTFQLPWKNNVSIAINTAEIILSKDHTPLDKKIPLDPYFGNERHDTHYMYATASLNTDLLFDFLSKLPRIITRRTLFELEQAK